MSRTKSSKPTAPVPEPEAPPPPSLLDRLNGMFAFVLWDAERERAIIARDHIGICPLYWGHDVEGRLWVASEMKALSRPPPPAPAGSRKRPTARS